MTDTLTADEFDARFDAGDTDDLFEWDEAFHDDIGGGIVDVAVRVYVPRALMEAASRIAERVGKTSDEFVADAIGSAIATA